MIKTLCTEMLLSGQNKCKFMLYFKYFRYISYQFVVQVLHHTSMIICIDSAVFKTLNLT